MRGTRRGAVTALAAATTVTLAACSGGEPAADDGEAVEIRFAWWGSDLRQELTLEAIDAFESEHPDITVTPNFVDWTGYWDRLSTTAAAGDMPDILQMDEAYLLTYAEQGSLMDISTLDVDTSNIDPAALPAGEVDGKLYGLVNAINTFSVVANADLYEEAGVELPDDESWTWEEFADLSVELSENTEDGVYGMQELALTDSDLDLWARQRGESFWTEEGEFGISEETLVEFWEYTLELTERGGLPPAAEALERAVGSQEQSATATNAAAMGLWWSNQFAALSSSSGSEMVLMRPPLPADGDERGIYYRPSQFWSVSSSTEHPEEVALFLDFLANSPEAGEILLVERGTPSNLEVREHITPMLEENDVTVARFLDHVSGDVGETAPLTPQGAADAEATLQRYSSEVLFGSLSPEEAAQQLTADLEEMIGG